MPWQVQAFLFLLAMLGVLAALLVLGAVLVRLGLVAAPSRLELRLRRPVAALVVLALFCILYGRLVEPWWPAVEHVRVQSAKWPAASSPLRLVQLSDLHCEQEPRQRFEAGLYAVQDTHLYVNRGVGMEGG